MCFHTHISKTLHQHMHMIAVIVNVPCNLLYVYGNLLGGRGGSEGIPELQCGVLYNSEERSIMGCKSAVYQK